MSHLPLVLLCTWFLVVAWSSLRVIGLAVFFKEISWKRCKNRVILRPVHQFFSKKFIPLFRVSFQILWDIIVTLPPKKNAKSSSQPPFFGSSISTPLYFWVYIPSPQKINKKINWYLKSPPQFSAHTSLLGVFLAHSLLCLFTNSVWAATPFLCTVEIVK